MFEHKPDYPMAVTDSGEEGLVQGWNWCLEHLGDGEHLTVWTPQKNTLSNNPLLDRAVTNNQGVDHLTGRGGGDRMRHRGPVLMAWPDGDDIPGFNWTNHQQITALCVVEWGPETLADWVREAHPEILGDGSRWEDLGPGVHPVVEAALENVKPLVNQGNSITAGFEKDYVVSALLALYDAGYHLNGTALAGWAAAQGWKGTNTKQLQKYVEQINSGSRPRANKVLRPNFMANVEAKVEAAQE